MAFRKFLACLLPLLAGVAHGQDERRVVSPDRQLEFRLFTAVPDGSVLNCLAYQVWFRGKPVLDTSYLGLDIHFQEPLLGENVGLSTDKPLQGSDYNGLFADYLQTSSTGRRIQLEVRVWNDGVAFRYIVPQSALLLNLLIQDDTAQFRFAHDLTGSLPGKATLPFVVEEPGAAWVAIEEGPGAGFPRMSLVRLDGRTMTARLPQKPHDPGVAFDGATPWTSPWRMIAVAADRQGVEDSTMARDLGR